MMEATQHDIQRKDVNNLKTFGFHINNDAFAEYSWYF